MEKFALGEDTLGYVTSQDPSNTDYRFLIGGSKNVMIDSQKKVKIRSGYTRLGAANPALYNNRNGWDWQTSTGSRLSHRFYNQSLEVYLTTVDGETINAWTLVNDGWSATNILRSTILKSGNGGWYDSTEKIDLCLMVQGDANIYEWNGAVAAVAAVSSATGIIATLSATPTAGGTGYTVGDILTITSGDGTATARVTAVGSSNAVTSVSIISRGTGYSTGTGKTTSGGTGTSATLDITTIGTGSITKAGTTTYVQNRFYTTRDMTVVNTRTRTEYTYTGGQDTQTIVGVGDTSGIQVGDVLFQKMVTNLNAPSATNINDYITNFQNQIIIGSVKSNSAFGSKNTDFDDFASSSPRAPGEGFEVTLDNPTSGITFLGTTLLIGAGQSVIFKVNFTQLPVGAAIAETVTVDRVYMGVNQGFLNQESIIPVGNTIFYLSNEVAARSIQDPNNLVGINPKALSNPIKPDFDAETWTNAFGIWYKNMVIFTAPATSHMYILNFIEDADGKTLRYWNPPQVLPVGPPALIEIDGVQQLYGHSNAVPETYLLFDGASDGQYADMPVEDKLAIDAHAVYAYNNFGKKSVLKNFDLYFAMGEITEATNELSVIFRYDYAGMTQIITETIDGSDEAILEGIIGYNSLGQQSLATNPLGGLLYPPADARRFRCDLEIAKEDFFELQVEFTTNDVDKYWAIIAHGSDVQLSRRRPINIHI